MILIVVLGFHILSGFFKVNFLCELSLNFLSAFSGFFQKIKKMIKFVASWTAQFKDT